MERTMAKLTSLEKRGNKEKIKTQNYITKNYSRPENLTILNICQRRNKKSVGKIRIVFFSLYN